MWRFGGLLVLAAGCGGKDDGGDGPPPVPAQAYATRPANATCVAPARPVNAAGVRIDRVFPSLSFDSATFAIQPPDDPGTWWVGLQAGRIVSFDAVADPTTTDTVVDLQARVDDSSNESGLLGLAFHPDWATNRQVVVSYNSGPPLRTVISRFRSTDGGATLDPTTEEVLLTVDQPFTNHNGGHVAFGPDGLLYLGLGDGGSGGDPLGNGQNTDTLLGAILRIDIDRGSPYAIPGDNPFVAGGGRPEIYAWGLRNPWRFAFDPLAGDLWLADVGQDAYEEVDRIRRGGNYGWNVMEADRCYATTDCDEVGLELPVVVTTHDEGDSSITGGVVYRGAAIPSLQGAYLFADYGSGRFYAVVADPVTGDPERVTLSETGLSPVHFAAGLDGEVLALDRTAGLYRLGPLGTPPQGETVPEKLSQTGCFDPTDPNRPGAMLIPYRVAHPFWSDGAEKVRYLSMPDGTSATVGDDGALDLPIGSVVVKEMMVGGRKVETRLLVRHDDGFWAGYAYEWNADGTEATLLPAAKAAVGGGGEPWTIPSRAQCLQCHNVATGGRLGLELRQLDLDQVYPNGAVENQVDLLVRLGMLEAPAERPGALPALADPNAPLDDRARAWLDVNCAFCHFDGGTGGGALDLRLETPLAQTGLCDDPELGDLGLPGAKVVVPGAPERSVLIRRISTRDADGMPPVASAIVDADGVSLLTEWVESLASCP